MTKTTLTPTQVGFIKNVTNALANMGCIYVITLPGGSTLTNGLTPALAPVEEAAKAPRTPSKFARGEMRTHIRRYVDGMKPGDSVLVPYEPYGSHTIQSGISAYMSETHGVRTYTTALRHEVKSVEVLFTGKL